MKVLASPNLWSVAIFALHTAAPKIDYDGWVYFRLFCNVGKGMRHIKMASQSALPLYA